MTLQSLRRGHALLATCEVGRERQAAKELRMVLERFVEEDRKGGGAADEEKEQGQEQEAGGGSIREELQQEIAALREAKGQGLAILPVDTVGSVLFGCSNRNR